MSSPKLNVSLSSRVFSVTGGASGMGAATVRLLAAQGASAIWIADLNVENMSKIKEEVAGINPHTRVYTAKVDVASSKEVDDWIAGIIAESGALHGAANIAGMPQSVFGTSPHILSQTDEDWARILGVNLDGVMYCTRAQLRAMIKMPFGSNPAIVNLASMASLLPGPGALAYSVSKAANAHFTTRVAKDVSSLGIRVNTVSPGTLCTPNRAEASGANKGEIGVTSTPMLKDFFGDVTKTETREKMEGGGFPMNVLDPSDVARSIVWLLSEASLPIHGVNLPIQGMVRM